MFTKNLSRPSKNTVLLILTVAAVTLLLSSGLSLLLSKVTNLEIPNIAMIKTIGIEAYWDKNLERKREEINWEIIWLGSSKNVTFYLRSISNEKTVLQLNATNWNPPNISKYMNLSWNYTGTPINPSEVIRVTITLSVPPSVRFMEYILTNNMKKFSFDIVITTIE